MSSFETRIPDRLSFPEALRRILAECPAIPPVHSPIFAVEGRAAAEEVRSTLTLPPGVTSHMDGYALRSEELTRIREDDHPSDKGARFEVAGKSLPGVPAREALAPGTAIRIMTGALLPPGTDTVIPVEETDREVGEAGYVRIRLDLLPEAPVPLSGRYLRPAGEEARAGEVLARPGDTLDYRLLAHLAAAGIEGLRVHPLPRVGLLVTGGELVPAGNLDSLSGGVRRADILTPSLSSLIRHSGGDPIIALRCGDDHGELADSLREISGDIDLLITTGGASMGEADLVKRVLVDLGGSIRFWGIRMRPGSPVSLASLPRPDRPPLIVLGLPGNPVSAIVTFTVLGVPALRSMGGHRRTFPRTLQGILRDPLPGPLHLTRFPRIRLVAEGHGRWGVHLSGEEGSGVIRGVSGGDGVAILPEGMASPAPGESIEVIPFPGAAWMAGVT